MHEMKSVDKKAIHNLIKKNIKASLPKNIMITFSVVLTIILFTILFTLTFSLFDSFQVQAFKEIGTTAHGSMKGISSEQYQKLESLVGKGQLKDISYDILVGNGKNEVFSKHTVEVRYLEEKAAKWNMITLIEGSFPTKENEIVMDDISLNLLGIEPKVGNTVHLYLGCYNKVLEKDFILSGYYKGNSLINASEVFISREFVDKNVYSIHSQEEWMELNQKQDTNAVGLIDALCYLKSSKNIEETLQNLCKEANFSNIPDFGVNWVYENNSLKNIGGGTIAGIILVLLIIMTAGYLIIYNIFYISVVNDTNYYGLLKMLGMLNSQIKKMIRIQSRIIYFIAMPIGLGIGWGSGNLLLPYIMKLMNNQEYQKGDTNLLIFVFSIVFSYITIVISMRKPCKIAAEISPIEALRYDGIATKNKKEKKGKTEGKISIYQMSYRNLFRNKKKTKLLLASISLVIILFFIVTTILDSVSLDKYLKMSTVSDFYVASSSLLKDYQIEQIEEDSYSDISKKEGVINCSKQYYQSSIHFLSENAMKNISEMYQKGIFQKSENQECKQYVEQMMNEGNSTPYVKENRYYFSKDIINKFDVLEGSIDEKKLSTGNYIIVIAQIGDLENDTFYHAGDRIELVDNMEDAKVSKKEDGQIAFDGLKKKEYEVMAVVKPEYSLSIRSFGAFELNTIICMDHPDAVIEDGVLYSFTFDVEDDKLESMEQYIKTYTEAGKNLDYNSIEKLKGGYSSLKLMIKLVGGILMAFIALIALFNYINCIATGIIIRKKEFAVLKSIGMEEKQLLNMLRGESVYYIIFSFVISIAAGSLLSISLLKRVTEGFFWFDYHFTILPTLFILPMTLLAAVILPEVVYGCLVGKSIVEELHEN